MTTTASQKFELEWYMRASDNKEIKPSHLEALKESAMERIYECLKKGYVSGELIDNICMNDEDDADGVEYSGWWTLKTLDSTVD